MRTVVVGGLGFIGSHLVRRLVDDGHEVTVLDRGPLEAGEMAEPPRASVAFSLRHRRETLLSGARIVRLDVVDRERLALAIEASNPDCIYYLAAAPIVSQVEANPTDGGRSMVLGLTQALEIVRARARPTRFVYVSSSMVYGHFEGASVSEDAPTRPVNVYGALKLAGEVLTHRYLANTPHDSVVVRPSGVYGPTDIHGRVVQKACEAALTGERFVAVNAAETFIDFTWVGDLAAGLAAAGDARAIGGETFNLTFGGARSLEELVAIVSHEAGHLDAVSTPTAWGHRPRRGALAIARARRLLGYRPQVDLETGVQRYIAFMGEQKAAPNMPASVLGEMPWMTTAPRSTSPGSGASMRNSPPH